jgi:hypothetical protein
MVKLMSVRQLKYVCLFNGVLCFVVSAMGIQSYHLAVARTTMNRLSNGERLYLLAVGVTFVGFSYCVHRRVFGTWQIGLGLGVFWYLSIAVGSVIDLLHSSSAIDFSSFWLPLAISETVATGLMLHLAVWWTTQKHYFKGPRINN